MSGEDEVDRTQPFPSQPGSSVRCECVPRACGQLSATPWGRSGTPLPRVLLSALPGSHGRNGLCCVRWCMLTTHIGGKCLSCQVSRPYGTKVTMRIILVTVE